MCKGPNEEELREVLTSLGRNVEAQIRLKFRTKEAFLTQTGFPPEDLDGILKGEGDPLASTVYALAQCLQVNVGILLD